MTKFAIMVSAAMAAVCTLVFFWPSAERDRSVDAPSALADTFPCTVTKVHDGDGPLWCAEGPKIRLTAITARELDGTCRPGHPCPDASGASAQAALENLALGQTLACEATGESYGRVTAWCRLPNGAEVNCAMVRSGHALHWAEFDPDDRLCR